MASRQASRKGEEWIFHMVLPVILNCVLVFCALYLVTGGLLRFWLLFMPDLTWLALICGSVALRMPSPTQISKGTRFQFNPLSAPK